VVWEAHPVS